MSYRHRGTDIGRQIAAAGARLLDYVTDLVTAGNRRRVVIRKPDGGRVGEVSLTLALVVCGLLLILVPTLVAITALGALVAGIQVQIVRDGFYD